MREILLTKGKVALVDDDIFEKLNQYKWQYHGKGYAIRSVTEHGKNRGILMHREILKTPEGMETDHRNGNKLDNQRCNLRVCTAVQNRRNRAATKSNTSGYKCVYWDKRRKNWQAYIGLGKRKTLGSYCSREDAAKAYDEAAREYFGEFARTNFGLEQE